MQLRDRPVHRQINVAPLLLAHASKTLIPKYATLNPIHDVKRAANNRFVLAKTEDFWNGHWGGR